MLWKDPKHILIRVGGWEGRSLFKVDVTTGEGKLVEKQRESVYDWWFDVDGNAVVRVEYSLGTLRYYRKMPDGKWKKYHSVRRKELDEQPEYDLIGPSTDPDKFYVLARPPGKDRIGIYLYDLPNESIRRGAVREPGARHRARACRRPTARSCCITAMTRTCASATSRMRARTPTCAACASFSRNRRTSTSSTPREDDKTILLRVEGPSEPPAFYYYLVDKKAIEFVGLQQGALRDKRDAHRHRHQLQDARRTRADRLSHLSTGRKGRERVCRWYCMPHGGPQVRDRLEFDPWVQYLAARGYAVFQPNFRGSGGFGEAFELSGHREWGRKMQDDLGDGVKALVDQGIVDPARVCIVGGSYGGYAALAGATLTPDAYKCAVSLAGIGDLEALVRCKKKKYGADSDVFDHYVRKLGDPEKDQQYLRATSPAVSHRRHQDPDPADSWRRR